MLIYHRYLYLCFIAISEGLSRTVKRFHYCGLGDDPLNVIKVTEDSEPSISVPQYTNIHGSILHRFSIVHIVTDGQTVS